MKHVDIKAYKVKNFKKMESEAEEIAYDFPVLYPSTKYFRNLQDLLASYGVILERLMKNDFDFEAYCQEIKQDPYLSVLVKETDFQIKGGEYQDCPLAEHVFNPLNEILWEAYYTSNPKTIIEKGKDVSMDVMLHITLGKKYNIYLNGSYMYASVKNKSYFVYLD
jgi:hypothetical protein